MGKTTPDRDAPPRLHIVATDTGYCNRLLSCLRRQGDAVSATVQSPQAWRGKADCDLLVVVDDGSGLAGTVRHRHGEDAPGYPLLVAGTGADGTDALPADDLPRLVREIRHHLAVQRQALENRRLGRQLHLVSQQLKDLADSSPRALAFLAGDRHLYCNSAYAALFENRARGNTSILDLVAAADRTRLAAALQAGAPPGSLRVHPATPGAAHALQLHLAPSFYKAQACLRVEAAPCRGQHDDDPAGHSDLITRLDNLPRFTERLDAAINAAVHEDVASILLLARIDRFRQVQECLGRAATHHVLADIAGFLRDGISKPYTAARLAPDEFGILLFNASPEDGAKLAAYIAGKVNDSLLPPTATGISLGASTGLAVINRHCAAAAAVVSRARMNTGNDRKHWTTGAPPAQLAAQIRAALAADRLTLRFQPVVSFHAGTRACYDVTFLLSGKDGTPLAGDDVIACANLHDIGQAIDRRVLERLLNGHAEAGFQVALSSCSLARPDTPAWLAGLLRRHRGKGDDLQLLISEIDLHSDPGKVADLCTALDALGVGIVLDDFGGAADPLPALAKTRPAGVRLDPALVRDLHYSRQQQRRLAKLVDAVHHRKIPVAVTALEDGTLLPLLYELGVDRVQGDCLHPPARAPDFVFPEEQVLTLPARRNGKSSRVA